MDVRDGRLHADVTDPACAVLGPAVHRALPDESRGQRFAGICSTRSSGSGCGATGCGRRTARSSCGRRTGSSPNCEMTSRRFSKRRWPTAAERHHRGHRRGRAARLPRETRGGREVRAVRHLLRRHNPQPCTSSRAPPAPIASTTTVRWTTAAGRPGSRSSSTSRTTRSSRGSGRAGCCCSGSHPQDQTPDSPERARALHQTLDRTGPIERPEPTRR